MNCDKIFSEGNTFTNLTGNDPFEVQLAKRIDVIARLGDIGEPNFIVNNGEVINFKSTLADIQGTTIGYDGVVVSGFSRSANDLQFDLSKGIILKDINNVRWRVTISTTGALGTIRLD